jgi:hypothetical protein
VTTWSASGETGRRPVITGSGPGCRNLEVVTARWQPNPSSLTGRHPGPDVGPAQPDRLAEAARRYPVGRYGGGTRAAVPVAGERVDPLTPPVRHLNQSGKAGESAVVSHSYIRGPSRFVQRWLYHPRTLPLSGCGCDERARVAQASEPTPTMSVAPPAIDVAGSVVVSGEGTRRERNAASSECWTVRNAPL